MSVSRANFLSTMQRNLFINKAKKLYVIQISQMRLTMIWDNNNSFISCFIVFLEISINN